MTSNSYMHIISGGDFNRSVVVRFQAGGETVTIKQQFVGADAEGYMRTNMIVNGNIPNIDMGKEVKVDDYKEEYTRNGPGKSQYLKLMYIPGFSFKSIHHDVSDSY